MASDMKEIRSLPATGSPPDNSGPLVESPSSSDATQDRQGGFSFYETYLRSPEWHERREHALEWAAHRCQACNSPEDLIVHHRTYERLGHEDPADLTVFCSACHDLFHDGGRVLGLYVDPTDVVS